MIGAGVFSAFSPAAAAAGSALLVSLGIAAVVATCNATASAQLAEAYPTSGGTYLYGREVLGEWWGFVAGWGFVVGKTASCAAMAMTFAAYVVPGGGWLPRLAAVGAVLVLTAANLRGITRTATVARVLLAVVLVTLAVAVVVCLGSGPDPVHPLDDAHGGVGGLLQAAGLLFFAFAGYARIATLVEEVRRPERLGRAVLVALGIVVLLYLVVGVALLGVLGPGRLASSTTPVTDAVRTAGASWAVPVVVVGAAAASLGALLALLAGVGRTSLAMARHGDLPRTLSSVSERHRVPDHAQVALAAVVVVLVLVADLRGAIGFSSFGVLVYYAVANLSALRQPAGQRRWPRAMQVVGVVGCVTLVVTLPPVSVLVGVLVFAVGVVGRLLLRSRRRPGVPA
ncbi:MAG: APC family permease [Nocardioidaceae bacterium]|nr:APC family permease [Nocardioidaceae bacterium]